MKIVMMAAVTALLGTPAMAQTPAPLQVDIPELATAGADPTCGGKVGLAQQTLYVVTTQGAIGGLVDTYSEAFRLQYRLAAGGDDNRVVYVRRRPEGGCDGFQMLAFADEARVPGPAEPAWLAFAAIPGDVCAAARGCGLNRSLWSLFLTRLEFRRKGIKIMLNILKYWSLYMTFY